MFKGQRQALYPTSIPTNCFLAFLPTYFSLHKICRNSKDVQMLLSSAIFLSPSFHRFILYEYFLVLVSTSTCICILFSFEIASTTTATSGWFFVCLFFDCLIFFLFFLGFFLLLFLHFQSNMTLALAFLFFEINCCELSLFILLHFSNIFNISHFHMVYYCVLVSFFS